MGCSPDCHNLAVTASLCLGCFAPAMSQEHSTSLIKPHPLTWKMAGHASGPTSGGYSSRNPRICIFPSLQRAGMGWGSFVSLSHHASPGTWQLQSHRVAVYGCDAHSGAWPPPGNWSANLKSENLCRREVQSHRRPCNPELCTHNT